MAGSSHTAARFTASWNAPWAGAPSPKNATATVPSARSCAAVAAPTAMGTPAATMPLAPKIPSFGSAMCIEPPAAAVGALVLAHQLGEHAERVEALGQAVAVAAVGRGDDVGGAQRPARPHGGRLLPDREVHEPGDLAVAVERGDPLLEPADQQHAPVHLDQVAGGEAPGRKVGPRSRRCIVLVGTKRERPNDRADRHPRVVPRAQLGSGQACGDHRRGPWPRIRARPRLLPGRGERRPRRPHRTRSQGAGRGAARSDTRARAAT